METYSFPDKLQLASHLPPTPISPNRALVIFKCFESPLSSHCRGRHRWIILSQKCPLLSLRYKAINWFELQLAQVKSSVTFRSTLGAYSHTIHCPLSNSRICTHTYVSTDECFEDDTAYTRLCKMTICIIYRS